MHESDQWKAAEQVSGSYVDRKPIVVVSKMLPPSTGVSIKTCQFCFFTLHFKLGFMIVAIIMNVMGK
jgi:hypothetical protein